MLFDEMFDINDCMIGSIDDSGEFKPICKISEAKLISEEVEENSNEDSIIVSNFDGNMECTFATEVFCRIAYYKWTRRLKDLIYGWRAKGPIRRRLINKE